MEVQKDKDGKPLVRRVDRKPKKVTREIGLLPGFGSHIAVPGLGRFVVGKPRTVEILESTLEQLTQSRCWDINPITLGSTIARLADGALAMVTKGKPEGPFLVQVPGEDLEREATADDLEDRVMPRDFLLAAKVQQEETEALAKEAESKTKGSKARGKA